MAKENTKKKNGTAAVIVVTVLLAAGLAILLYPTVSDQLNRYRQKQVISDYVDTISVVPTEEAARLLEEAEEYNRTLPVDVGSYLMTEQDQEDYDEVLDVTGTGIMGYLRIPKIGVDLPVYHETSEEGQQSAIVHIAGSSLPVGGKGTHAVISGHRGLPSARLFTDIDQLEEGDRFYIRVLDRRLTYEVDQIRTILPEEMDELVIDPERDWCTLVTCTPYGVNTHRLLVRGVRIPDEPGPEEEIQTGVDRWLVILLAAAPVLLAVVVILVVLAGRKRHEVQDPDSRDIYS